MDTKIKAPFNFVPLENKVYFPEWGGQISRDIPFKDSMSGYFDMDITACSPLFIRNGHSKEDGKERKGEFCKFSQLPDGRYFIPSTSVKGCIRNVFEIMTFGKMRVDTRAMFAQREWNNTKLYTLKDIKVQKNICGGWLKKGSDGKYFIQKCSNIYRINHKRIDEILDTDLFARHFRADSKFDLNKTQKIGENEFDPKTACFKYELLKHEGYMLSKLENIYFTEDDEYACKYQEGRVMASPTGDIKGNIVLTGQPDLAKKWEDRSMGDGKFYEFVFTADTDGEFPVDESVFESYEFVYANSADWEYAKRDIRGRGIPVFFRLTTDAKKVRDFGLALLYRLPYEHKPVELERSRYSSEKGLHLDFADCVFGCANDNTDNSLKGRVYFTHFVSDNAERDKNYTLVLNGPKASYYPIYIRQNFGNRGTVTQYQTYNDGQLAGWKRYVHRKNVWEKSTGDPKLDTVIYPLKSNSVFSGRVYFHNLKPVELGALISAITWHGDSECYHQMGQGKPYGFGRVKMEIKPQKDLNMAPKDLLAEFEMHMDKVLDAKWIGKPSICQLFTLAHEIVVSNDIFEYMKLEMKSKENNENFGANEFVDAKMLNEYLQNFSAIIKTSYTPKTVVSEENLKAIEEQEKNNDQVEAAAGNEAMGDKLKALGQTADALQQYKKACEILMALGLDVSRIQAKIESLVGSQPKTFAEIMAVSKYVSTDLTKWCKREGRALTEDEYAILRDRLLAMTPSDRKKGIKSKKEVIKAIGDELAKKLFEEIGYN